MGDFFCAFVKANTKKKMLTWRHTLILFISLGQIHSIEREMTFPIKAQAEECFYETALIGQTIEIDYQVVDGGSAGSYAIDFSITKPDGHPAISEWDKSENSHQVIIDQDGDYKICFDNSKSSSGSKLIFFELIVDNDGSDDLSIEEFDYKDEYDEVESMSASLSLIRERMKMSRHLQEQIRAHEFRDRSIAEHNFERINFWSFVQVAIMIAAGLTQVMMIRSIFDEKSPVRKLFK